MACAFGFALCRHLWQGRSRHLLQETPESNKARTPESARGVKRGSARDEGWPRIAQPMGLPDAVGRKSGGSNLTRRDSRLGSGAISWGVSISTNAPSRCASSRATVK